MISGSGLKCFICNSHYDPGCADWFNNFTYPMKDCAMYGKPNATMCRKMVIEAFYDGDWRWRYHRECANHGEVGPFDGRLCHDRVGTFRVKVRYCHCNNKEGCNSGPHFTPSLSVTWLLPLLLTMLFISTSNRMPSS